MASERASGVEPVGAGESEGRDLDLKDIGRVGRGADRSVHGHVETSLHFVFHIWQFPRGIYWPICACGWLPDDGFSSCEAASACACERQRAELRAAVRHVG